MKVGDVVKCSYEFPAETDGDLAISPGDLIKITKVVNNDWCEGISNGKKGQFPTAFVEPSNEMFDVGIAISNFEAQQEGDLSLLQGEFVIISEKIDDNWYSGYTHGGSKGIFPVNFIQKIDFSGNNDMNSAHDNNDTVEQDPVTEAGDWFDVIENFSAADSSELDLVKGTNVKVLSHVDEFWCHGETVDGKQGIFPKSFLNMPTENSSIIMSGDNTSVTNNVSEPSPVETKETVVVDAPVPEIPQPISKARALFTFQGTEKGDLSFAEGDEIFILEKIDDSWLKGQNGADIGIFPSNYVQIYDNELQETKPAMSIQAEKPQANVKHEPVAVVKKKKPPGRPKPPVLKKDCDEPKPTVNATVEQPKPEPKVKPNEQLKPFSYYFTTESQPTVIIPSKYAKPGIPNVVAFRKNNHEEKPGFANNVSYTSHDTQKSYNESKHMRDNFNTQTNNVKASFKQASTNSSAAFEKATSYAKEESQKLKTKGNVIGNELQSINKNLPNDNMSTFQKVKSANSNLNSVVKISNEVGIKTTKKEVLTNAAKIGVAGYATGSKSNKPALPAKSFLKSK